MKKFILVFLTFLLLPSFAGATIGACSGHDGVNCAAGPDVDGSVICNDGWKGSEVLYVNHEECFIPYAPADGDLVKLADMPAVYYVQAGKRYSFPFLQVYYVYYGNDFSSVKTIKPAEMANLMLTGNVLLPTNTLVKIQSDPKVYRVDYEYNLVWIETEAAAIEQFGADWAKKVIDVPVAFFIDYQMPEKRSIAIKGLGLNVLFKIEKDFVLTTEQEKKIEDAKADGFNMWSEAVVLKEEWLNSGQIKIYVYTEAGSGNMGISNGKVVLQNNNMDLIIEYRKCTGTCPTMLEQDVVSFLISNLEQKAYNYTVTIKGI